ncbi:unnamed protein product [Amoebophrya sp. A25]|nr:unnamed protein product [Amoebophrya sp. A25]|eukprot:GSA25T00019887001.1
MTACARDVNDDVDIAAIPLQLWSGSVALARYLLDEQGSLFNENQNPQTGRIHIVELGGGVGLCSVVAMRILLSSSKPTKSSSCSTSTACSRVTCTDRSAAAVSLAAVNLRKNSEVDDASSIDLFAKQFDFSGGKRAVEEFFTNILGRPQSNQKPNKIHDKKDDNQETILLLGADLLYERESTLDLISFITELQEAISIVTEQAEHPYAHHGKIRVTIRLSYEERVCFSKATLREEVTEVPLFLEAMENEGINYSCIKAATRNQDKNMKILCIEL